MDPTNGRIVKSIELRHSQAKRRMIGLLRNSAKPIPGAASGSSQAAANQPVQEALPWIESTGQGENADPVDKSNSSQFCHLLALKFRNICKHRALSMGSMLPNSETGHSAVAFGCAPT
jgi:hypothetical protein